MSQGKTLLFNDPEPVTPLRATRDVPRSVLRYFGGKWAIAPWIIGNMPPHRVYVEPFGGAASVLLRKPRSKIEVYNDLDDEIVGVFRVLQNPDQCRRLFRLLRRTPYSRLEFLRAFEASTDPVERTRRAIVRAYQSFHHSALFNPGKCVFANAKHRYGGYSKSSEWMNYPRVLAHVRNRLSGVVIEHRPALKVIQDQDTHDALFYVDPPYVMPTRHKSTCYRHELPDAGHLELLSALKAAQGRVMISGYASALYDDNLVGWKRITRKTYAQADNSRERTEVLWISPG